MLEFLPPEMLQILSTFLFVFAVVFGVLSYTKLFDNKRVNAIIAVAIGFFSMMYEPLVFGLSQYMPIAIGLLIILFFVALLKKVFGNDKSGDNFPIIVSLGVLMLLLIVFADDFIRYVPIGLDPTNLLWIIGLIFAALFFWFVYKHK